MNNKHKLLIFDWDGTLVDSIAHIVRCVQQAANNISMPVPDAKFIREGIGLGLVEAVYRITVDWSETDRERLVEQYRALYIANHQNNTAPEQLFPEAKKVLETLKNQDYYLAVATGKSRKGLERSLDTHALRHYFVASRCADETTSKPNPQMLHELLEEMMVKPEEALMIGDTEYDMDMAQQAKVPALAVSYGVHTKERLLTYDPVGCIDELKELLSYLK